MHYVHNTRPPTKVKKQITHNAIFLDGTDGKAVLCTLAVSAQVFRSFVDLNTAFGERQGVNKTV